MIDDSVKLFRSGDWIWWAEDWCTC